jgi:RNA 3'-terminal phosphate cyclase (ATP)
VQPSLHAQTAMWVAKEIIGVDFDDEGTCEGVGYVPVGSEEVAELARVVDTIGI